MILRILLTALVAICRAQPKYAYFCDEGRGICQPCLLHTCERHSSDIYASARECIRARKCTVVYTLPDNSRGLDGEVPIEALTATSELGRDGFESSNRHSVENHENAVNSEVIQQFEARRTTPRHFQRSVEVQTVLPTTIVPQHQPTLEKSPWRYYCRENICELCEMPDCPVTEGLLFESAAECSRLRHCSLPAAIDGSKGIVQGDSPQDVLNSKFVSGLKYLEEQFEILSRKVSSLMEVQQVLVERSNYLLRRSADADEKQQPFNRE